ncbi:Hypothetical predicted protein [Cloeon dipterum]|uniref:Uncharacterized protein n=1 Tax=Cloeon dipterum TaxID=197152 RepID=A0A8S1DWP9_9INSE|nr:Hypothetical predicted protein [Cloeon dipterum]
MAFDTAVKNLGRYKELIRSKVSPPFRKELYEEARKSVWQKTFKERFGLWTTLPYLEPHKTAEIIDLSEFVWAMPELKVNPGCDFDDDDEFFDAPCDAILSYLGQHAPNLKELYIVYPWPYDLKKLSKKPLLDSSSIDLIVKMKNLTRISIHSVQINFTGFVRICREFQNVQEISSQNILLDVPKSELRVILDKFNTAFDHQEYTECTFPTIFGISFEKTDSGEIYRTAQVDLDDSIFVDSLPELTHLKTSCGYDCKDYQCHIKNFQHILSKNIFEYCESLEFLDLRSSYIADANEPLNSFGKLKEFDWCYADEDHALTLKSILCAPLLEKIHLISYKFDLGDKEAFFNQIRSGEICTNVKCFTVKDLKDDDEPAGTPSTDARRATNPELELFLPSHSRRLACVFAVVSSNFLISAEFKMVDVEYYAMTKKKLFSLQEMAFDTAVKNLGRYKELIRSKVSPPFRKELYEEARKSVWQKTCKERFGLWTALPYLEPHKMVESIVLREFAWAMPELSVNPGCDFDDDDEFFDATCNAILSYLGQHAPNLKELYIVDTRPYYVKKLPKKPLLDSKSFQINFTGFVRICRESQNVQEIEATKILLDVPKSDLRAILEEFNTAFDHQEYTERTFPTIFGILFKRTDSAEIYRTARVDLNDSIFVDSLPELTHLRNIWDYDCKNYQCNMKNFQHILSKVGGSLKKLTLNYFSRKSKLTFKNIFEQCEYLESLDLRSSYIADANEPLNSFGKLKEFDWSTADKDHALTLKSILCAPLLEKIHLISYKFDLGDKEALFNQIRRGEICTNVKYFTVEDLKNDDVPAKEGQDRPELLTRKEFHFLLGILGFRRVNGQAAASSCRVFGSGGVTRVLGPSMSVHNADTKNELAFLQEIAFDAILKNLGSYKELFKSKLSPPLRRELYERARIIFGNSYKTYKEKCGFWTALSYLEPHKAEKYFHLTELCWIPLNFEVKPGISDSDDEHDSEDEVESDSDDETDYDVSLDEILHYLVQHAPILDELRIDNPRHQHWQNFFRKLRLEPSSIDLIVQMENLTKISIEEVNIEFSGFVRICRELKTLQKINANRIKVDVPKSDIKAILETFNTAFDYQGYGQYTFPRKIGIYFEKTDSAEHVREACIGLDDSIFVDFLPELTHLQARCSSDCEAHECHVMNFLHILSKVGGSLKKLSLFDFDRTTKLTFKKIFEHCNSLEGLYIDNSIVADVDEPISSFGKLKEFCWYFADYGRTITLKHILFAPLLEKIDVAGFKFDLGDKEALFNRIENGEMSTNLEEFLVMDKTDNDKPVWDDIEELFRLIQMNSPQHVFTWFETFSFRPHRFSS